MKIEIDFDKIKDVIGDTINDKLTDVRCQKFIDNILNEKLTLMDSVHRQSTMLTIKPENIAQHSFYVAFYALKICKSLGLSKDITYEVTTEALVHDIAETEISDIPGNMKHKNPELKMMLNALEEDAINKYYPEVSEEFASLQKHESELDLVGTIVKLADVIAFIQKCNVEQELGNQSIFLKKAYEHARDEFRCYYDNLIDIMQEEYEHKENEKDK